MLVTTFVSPDPTAQSTKVGDQNAATPSDLPRPSASAAGPEGTREEPPTTLAGVGETSSYVSLLDFSATEILSHLIQNDVYIGQGWEHVKEKSCNRKMEFFFNCHSLVGFRSSYFVNYAFIF